MMSEDDEKFGELTNTFNYEAISSNWLKQVVLNKQTFESWRYQFTAAALNGICTNYDGKSLEEKDIDNIAAAAGDIGSRMALWMKKYSEQEDDII